MVTLEAESGEEDRRNWRKKKRKGQYLERGLQGLATIIFIMAILLLVTRNHKNKESRFSVLLTQNKSTLESAIDATFLMTDKTYKINKKFWHGKKNDIENLLSDETNSILIVEANSEICKALRSLAIRSGSVLSLVYPPKPCPSEVRYIDGPLHAHCCLLATKVSESGNTKVIVIINREERHVKHIFMQCFQRFKVSPIFQEVNFQNGPFYSKKIKRLLKSFPNVPVVFTSGETFCSTIDLLKETTYLHNRMVMSHTNFMERLKLLQDPFCKHSAQELALVTTAIEHIELSNLQFKNTQDEMEIYFTGLQILSSIHRLNGDEISLNLMRMIPKELLSTKIIQHYPWWIEASAHFTKTRNDIQSSYPQTSWKLVEYHPRPSKIITKEDIFKHRQDNCLEEKVIIKAKDPVLKEDISRVWDADSFPQAVAIPNSLQSGFQIKVTCKQQFKRTDIDIGCDGSPTMNTTVKCFHVHSNGHGRRVIRSYYQNQDFKVPDGHIDEVIKKKLVKDEIKSIIPSIAGCVGATSGCSLCYIYLMYVPVDVNPGVCYGACAVAVGGSCSSLIARGVQGKYDSTVICTELFHQGYIELDSLMADARYGRKLEDKFPLVMDGYRIAASPIVNMMKTYPQSTKIVHKLALPWIRHMEFVEHERDAEDYLGVAITCIGSSVCYMIGFYIANIKTTIICLILAFMIMKLGYR